MNDLDDRVRDALAARAGVVTADPAAYVGIARRRDRRRWARRARPIGAVASVVAVAGLVAVAGRIPPSHVVHPSPAGPARVIAIRDYRAVMLDAEHLDGPPLLSTVQADGNVVAVAAVGDGRTFYVAANFTTPCQSAVYRIDATEQLTPHVQFWSTGRIGGLAVTRDELTLAYSTSSWRTEKCPNASTVHVRDILTGTERIWRGPDDGRAGSLPRPRVDNLSWSPDGRYLAYTYDGFDVARLDTHQAGPLPTAGHTPIHFGSWDQQCYAHAAAYLPSGELAAAIRCMSGFRTAEYAFVAVFDPTKRTVGRVLFRMAGPYDPRRLALDASGRHAFLTGVGPVGRVNGGQLTGDTAYRWDAGHRPRRLPDQQQPDVTELAW